MNVEDALRIVKYRIKNVKYYAIAIYDQLRDVDKEEIKYYKIIIDALEKQIPKKVIVNKDGCRNCPNCYANESWICYEQDVNEPFEYCACCGQKLDWENNK